MDNIPLWVWVVGVIAWAWGFQFSFYLSSIIVSLSIGLFWFILSIPFRIWKYFTK
jgi:hypothetical protein